MTNRIPGKSRKTSPVKEVREATVEARIQQIAAKYGGEALKMTGYKGIPDRLIVVNGYYLWCEVKRRTGKTSHEQDLWLAKIRRKFKGHCCVVYGMEDLPMLRQTLKMMAEAQPAPWFVPWAEETKH